MGGRNNKLKDQKGQDQKALFPFSNKLNKLKRFFHLAISLSESEKEKIILESDEKEERLTDGSAMKKNCSNNIPAILQQEHLLWLKFIALCKTLKSLLPKLLMALMKKTCMK